MYYIGESTTYPYYLVFGVAGVAFYKISVAIYGILRKRKGSILSILKVISFVDACVSLVVAQCALLTMQNSPSATTSSALLGMACSVLFFCIGIYMMFRKKKYPERDDIYEVRLEKAHRPINWNK